MICHEDIITNSKLMQWYRHKSQSPIPLKRNTIEPFLFNKSIKLNKAVKIKPSQEINLTNMQ